MKTKQFFTAFFLCLFINTNFLFAQLPPPKNENIEMIETMKIAYLTKELDLTQQEAQQFWPVYNEYNQKLKDARKKRRIENKDTWKNIDKLTDKEIEQILNNNLASRQKELDLQKEFTEKFKAILPIKKVAKLYAAEEKFKMVLFNKLKENKSAPK